MQKNCIVRSVVYLIIQNNQKAHGVGEPTLESQQLICETLKIDSKYTEKYRHFFKMWDENIHA